VTVGTIGTIINRTRLFKDVVAILVDEVHRVPPAKSSQYRQLFEKLPKAKVHGLTGTPFRADGTGDLAKTFGPIVYRYTFLDALRDGYVKPLVPVDAGEDEQIDTAGLATSGDDFDLEEMAPRAIKLVPSHARTMLDVMRRYNRRCVIVFCCNIDHAEKFTAEVRRLTNEFSVTSVHSRSPTGHRDKAVAAFQNRLLNILVSVEMFNTGFDVPDIDYEVFARATKSAVYYAQGLGRGARLTPYAHNCLVSDFGGNIERHGTLDAVAAAPGKMLTCDDGLKYSCGQEWETWENGKTCPSCKTLHKSAPKCKACSERFDPHFHGLRCPHCGSNQADLKKCAACEESYAAFLHPICPFCAFDNTITTSPGKDLTSRGGAQEAVNVAKIIAAEPWQPIIASPVKDPAGGWQIPTKFIVIKWPYEQLPPQPQAIYVTKAANGRYMAQGVYDASGHIFQK
jgi:superfamily II DNA or RNA helicase